MKTPDQQDREALGCLVVVILVGLVSVALAVLTSPS